MNVKCAKVCTSLIENAFDYVSQTYRTWSKPELMPFLIESERSDMQKWSRLQGQDSI